MGINGHNYQVVVLGGGPGGYVAAIRAAQLGARVALIEKASLGGTCLNVGCMPTKTMFNSAKIIHDIVNAREKGILVETPKVHMPQVVANKDKVVEQLVSGIKTILDSYGINIYSGKGHVNGDKTLQILEGEDQGEIISYEKLIIATGSTASLPSIPGCDEPGILTSTELLDIQEVPKELVIIGAGIIGCEFAAIFNSFGSQVTIIARRNRILPNMDEEISEAISRSFKNIGIRAITGTKVEKIEKSKNKYLLTLSGENNEIIEAEKVLAATGRKVTLEGLEDLRLDVGNAIGIDEYLKTSVKDVYAVGDVTGKTKLAHVASAQGIKAAENALGKKSKMKYHIIPNCIYTIPEVGTVGLSEKEAREKYKDISIGRFPMYANGKALALGETEGFTKIIVHEKYDEILGVHIVGPNATEIIAEAAILMKLEGTVEELVNTIHGHPTASETLYEAGYDALGGAINMTKKDRG